VKRKISSSHSLSYRPFAILGDLMSMQKDESQQNSRQKQAAPMQPTEDELFIRAMHDVREIPEFRAIPVSFKKSHSVTCRQKAGISSHDLLKDIIKGKRAIILAQTQEFISWLHPKEVRHAGDLLIERLHQGAFSVQDFIDLHGCTVLEADDLLDSFIKESMRKGFGCVKIIHGRGLRSAGTAVLKSRVAHLLSTRFAKFVRAYVTAPATDGGLGAVYVLLRQKPLLKK
jgi:DNA-nicking Smr family endonuclease